MEELKATMQGVRYRNAERTWLVATMKREGSKESFIATGDIPYSETEEPVQLYGEWVEDKTYGKQFKVTASHRVLPTSVQGLRNYLAASEDIKGVGPVRADKLAEHFGSKLLSILDKEPNRLSECNGISVELAQRIADGWSRDSAIRQVGLFLARHGVSPRWAGRIIKQWDAAKAVRNIESNPYSLTEIEGIGFITADEIAQSMGWKKDSPARIAAACIHVVSAGVSDGNVYLHEHELVDGIVKIVSPRGKNVDEVSKAAVSAVAEAIVSGQLIAEEISDGVLTSKLVYLPHLYRAEKALAERIAELNESPHTTPRNLDSVIAEVQDSQNVKFSTKQLEAIRGAFSNHFVVITGGPGTGKTTCVKAICDAAERLHKHAVLCAPTGRAAKRLSEVTGRGATTIHRLLKWGENGPQHFRGNPIDGDVLIVDESSMLDLELGQKILDAIHDECTVVFIGDVDQLPSVGAGSTLRDIIRSGSIPVVSLDTIFRQAESSLIIRNSHLIRRGEMPRFPEGKGVRENSYVMWIPPAAAGSEGGRDDAEWLKTKLARVVGVNIPQAFGAGKVDGSGIPQNINPIRDIQVLVPMKKHTIGANELNKVLQEALNPNGEVVAVGGKAFKIGDRVMQTRNNYDEGMDVYNGDIGFITANRPEDKCLDVDFDGRAVSYPYSDAGDLQLAYAQTIHKSQGSEYPVVVVVMGFQHWPMLERNLLYTANTRAKQLCLFMASKGAIERAVKNNPVHQRNTFLAQRIRAYTTKETVNA